MRSSWIVRGRSKSHARYLYKKSRRHRDTERPCEGGRDWSYEAPSQGMPKVMGSHQKLGERRHGADSPSEFPEGTSSAKTLILNFQPPELWKNNFLLFQAANIVVISYSSFRKLIQSKCKEVLLSKIEKKVRDCEGMEEIVNLNM